MTKEQINIAIAEHLGWKKKREVEPGYWVWFAPNGNLSGQDNIPNYASDLNAMHEAEKVLSSERLVQFWMRIPSSSATAPQRAEAFLRTVGKWQETPDNQQPITDNPAPTP
jgi:hypothetical protein